MSGAEKVLFEQERKICVFALELKSSEADRKYLEKGAAGVLLGKLRDIEILYTEELNPKVIYHEFGDNPISTLEERIESESTSFKKKSKPVRNFKELEEVRKGIRLLPPEKDPRFLSLKWIDRTEESTTESKVAFSATQRDCHFAIAGTIQSQSDNLLYSVYLYDAWSGERKYFSHKTSFIRSYQEMEPLVISIRKGLLSKDQGIIEVNAGNVENPLVYVNGVYLGKPPFKKEFYVGSYDLQVFKEGYLPYKRRVEVQKDKQIEINFQLESIPSNSVLIVETDIPDAEVYWGIQYMGKTPLRTNIPSGKNRLRITKEGYVDAFRGIDGKPGYENYFSIKLRPGDTEIYYKNKQNVFLDYTYKDFATYSLYGSLFFYLTYVYFNLESRKALEAARPQVQIVNGQALLDFASSNSRETAIAWYLWQSSIIENAEAKAKYYKELAGTLPIENRRNRQFVAGGMVMGIGLALASAMTFFVLGLDEESYDIGFDLAPTPQGMEIIQNFKFINRF